MSEGNGAQKFGEIRNLISSQSDRLENIERILERLADNTSGLGQINTHLEGVVKEIYLMRTEMMGALTGIPLSSVEQMMGHSSKHSAMLIKTLCALLVVLLAWFTGIKYFLPGISN